MNSMQVSFDHVVKSSDHCLGHLAAMTSILINQQRLNSVSVGHNLTKFLIYKPSQFHRFTEFTHFLQVVEKYIKWFFDMKFFHFSNFINLKVNHMRFYFHYEQ